VFIRHGAVATFATREIVEVTRNLLSRAFGLVALAGVLAGAFACEAERAKPAPLRFSAIPDQDETRLREKFTPVAAYLSDALGVPVEYVHATKYSDSVDLFKNGDIQLAWFGGLTGVQARHAVAGARAIAQGAEDPEFYSYFIAHASTGIERSGDYPVAIAGKKFTFGSMGSTSGRLMPESFIRENTGKAPSDVFSAVSFSGSHDKTAELIESGQFAVGALNYQVYDRRVAEGTTDPRVVKVIWKTPVYADYNFTAHPDLETTYGAGFTDRLQAVLIAMSDPGLLSSFPRSALIAAENSDFDAIHKLALQLDFIR
jgi:phosphonate transport system substrate-binding protein